MKKKGIFHICEQLRLIRRSLTQYRELEEASDKEAEIWPQLMPAHARFKDHKPHKAKDFFS